ncbi:MAG: PASTA domain-containing protein, partial [Acidimicrobiales bacterium]
SPSGQVKVADFGIARAVSNQENLTQTGTVMGTATYSSPEQARGESVDPRSDVYSLGVVPYEMLTGRPPFTGDSSVAVAYKHVQEAPRPPRAPNPDIPLALEAVGLHAMAKDTAERYASAEDLRADLRRFREGNQVQAATVVVAPVVDDGRTRAVGAVPVADWGATRAVPASEGTTVLRERDDRYDEAPSRRPNAAFIVVLVALLVVLAGLLFLLATNLGGGGQSDQVSIPNLVNQKQVDAERLLRDQDLVPRVTEEENADVEAGVVIAQDPVAGTKVKKGAEVALTVSSGAAPVAVPRVVGLSEIDARGRLETASLVGDFRPQESSEVAKGKVISQDPAQGEMAAPKSTVVVLVSSGPPTVTVPSVVGQDQGSATNILSSAGFRPQVRQQAAEQPAGTVVATDPPPNSQADKGSTITIVVSTGPATTTTAAPTTTSTTQPKVTTTTQLPTTTTTA